MVSCAAGRGGYPRSDGRGTTATRSLKMAMKTAGIMMRSAVKEKFSSEYVDDKKGVKRILSNQAEYMDQ